jgi:hypothetical protein
VVLHFDVKTNSVFKHQPEVTSFVLYLLCVSVSKEIFALNFLVEEFFFLSDTKKVVVFDDLSLSKSSLPNIVLIYSNHTIIRWEAELGIASHDSNLVIMNIKHILM